MKQAASLDQPEIIETEETLDEFLTRPRLEMVQFIRSVRNPLVILSAGEKMEPTLTMLARRAEKTAGHKLDVIAVSRFSNAQARRWLEERDVQTLSCDLFDADQMQNLPPAEDVLFLVDQKFGTIQSPAGTWT